MKLAIIAALITLSALTITVNTQNQHRTALACVHGGSDGTIGNDPFHCWCREWAHTNTTRYRICRIIWWSDGRETALPPHE